MGALLLFIVTLGSLLVLAVGLLGFLGRLPRNPIAGIRTRYTMRNDDNWQRAHREGGPFLIFSGVAAVAVGLAFLPFALAGKISDGLAIVAIVVQAIIIGVGAVLSASYGIARAKRLEGS